MVVADRVCSRIPWRVIEYRMRRIFAVGTYVMLLLDTTVACPFQVQIVGGIRISSAFTPLRRSFGQGCVKKTVNRHGVRPDTRIWRSR